MFLENLWCLSITIQMLVKTYRPTILFVQDTTPDIHTPYVDYLFAAPSEDYPATRNDRCVYLYLQKIFTFMYCIE